jgi:glycosyltransferase involved in cell wall biosynthesis
MMMLRSFLLFIWLFITRKNPRRRHLISQYLRAKLLPDWAIKVKKNTASLNRSIDISILITCYNYSDYVQTAINSIIQSELDQLNIEIIIVNDSSTDNSQEILESYLDHIPHSFLIIKTRWNVGLTRARNIALNHAQGRYIFILDADNSINPKALYQLYSTAESTKAHAAYGPIQKVLPNGSLDGLLSNQPFNPKILTNGNYIDAMSLIRTSTLKNLGGYDLELLKIIGGWEDYDLWLNLANQSMQVSYDSRLIGSYLWKPDSMVKNITPNEMFLAMQHFRKKYAKLPWSQ